MNRLIIFLFYGALACLSAYAQVDSDDVVRVETSLVVVPVRVLDLNGRFIPNLKRENFRVFENKTEQEIADFETDNSPFTVALMLDVSDSTKFKLKEIQDAAVGFLNQLRPNDTAIVFAFNSNLVKIYEGGAKNLENLKESVQLTRTGGGTSLYDAVGTVISEYLNKISRRKKAIVLFTDGIDTQSRENYLNSLRAAQESNALIYSIQYDTFSDDSRRKNTDLSSGAPVNIVTAKGESLPLAYKRGTSYLNLLSGNSGGKFYFADTIENLTKAFSQIAAELGQQYVLTYYPQNQAADGKSRTIKINVNVQKAKVKARKSYTLNSKNKQSGNGS